MARHIITPPDLSGAALAAFKQWLAITTAGENALLLRLLSAAHDTCERFTGLMPLAATVEEVFDPRAGWLALATRPVRAIASLALLDAEGTVAPLENADWSRRISADGSACVRLTAAPVDQRIVVRFSAGLATGWETIPPALGDGILRLAAHHYRSRGDASDQPPAAVAALWRAWRRLRL